MTRQSRVSQAKGKARQRWVESLPPPLRLSLEEGDDKWVSYHDSMHTARLLAIAWIADAHLRNPDASLRVGLKDEHGIEWALRAVNPSDLSAESLQFVQVEVADRSTTRPRTSQASHIESGEGHQEATLVPLGDAAAGPKSTERNTSDFREHLETAITLVQTARRELGSAIRASTGKTVGSGLQGLLAELRYVQERIGKALL